MNLLKKCLLVFLVSLILSGCSGNGGVRKYSAYTVYPVGYLLNRIGGNRIVTTSIQNSALVQTSGIIAEHKEVLEDSAYLFHIGELEPYFEIYSEEIRESGTNVIDLSVLNSIYHFQRYTPVSAGGSSTFIESPYYDGECFDVIDDYDDDLFLWLDPIGMLSMAKDVASTLSNNYVEQSSYFNENLKQLESDLIALDANYQNLANRLKKEGRSISFVSMTASFGCWQKAYGFGVYPVCLSKYGALPTDEQLAIIKKRIADDGVKYIAYEPNMSDDMLELFKSLESELSLKRINLSNISSLTFSQQSEKKDYISLMYENLGVLESISSLNTEEQ